MTLCDQGFEFIARPTPYPREPFQLASGELVGFEGRFYSAPAYALLADLRLMRPVASHPVANPFKLYINKDTGLSPSIEPRLDASGYETATPHYAEYVIDCRDAIDTVTALHAGDSEHPASRFKGAHLRRQRAPYDLDNTSASGTSDGDYVHPIPAATVPTGNELGAGYMQDIDLDEVMWQPFTRPKDKKTITSVNVPVEPIFPAVLNEGSLPTFTALDNQHWDDLGYGAGTSGGLVVTGDRLLAGSSIKLLTGSGQPGVSEGSFKQGVPWALFPSEGEMCRYYEGTESGVFISASGRQAIYNPPVGLASNRIHLLDVSDVGTSGEVIQTYPANFQSSISGVRGSDRKTHAGVHNVSKLLYNINATSPGFPVAGHSPINGAIVFAHFGGTEVGSKGQTIGVSPRYANGDTLYGYGGILKPHATGFPSTTSTVEWFTTDNKFSPLTWNTFNTSALGPAFLPFANALITIYDVGDINFAPNDGVITRKQYALWGFVDSIICPDLDRAQGGQRISRTITYTTYRYFENGVGGWNLAPGFPTVSSSEFFFYEDTYDVNGIFSFFLFRRGRNNKGWVNVNGNIYFQWSEQGEPGHKFIPLGARQSRLEPARSRTSSVSSIGFFPSWKVTLTITTNNQVTVPTTMGFSPGASILLTFAPELGLTISDIRFFGPAVWDPVAGHNYIYFQLQLDRGGTFYFAKFDTNFEIFEMNKVEGTDAILTGRMALLSI